MVVPSTRSHDGRDPKGGDALQARWKRVGVTVRACGKVCGGGSFKVQDENGALERHQLAFFSLPASDLSRATPLLQPFWAARALDGRKGLLWVLT